MITINMSDDVGPFITEMQRILNIKDPGGVVTQALMLLQAAVNAHAQGFKTGYINDDGAVIPIFDIPKTIDLEAADTPKTE